MKTALLAATTALLSLSSLGFGADLNRLLSVKGMTCPACSAKVEHALTQVPGVTAAHVDLKSGQAGVVADEQIKSAQLVDAVRKAGFEAEAVKPGPASLAADPCCH
jgi:P-type Cu+ transporter